MIIVQLQFVMFFSHVDMHVKNIINVIFLFTNYTDINLP